MLWWNVAGLRWAVIARLTDRTRVQLWYFMLHDVAFRPEELDIETFMRQADEYTALFAAGKGVAGVNVAK